MVDLKSRLNVQLLFNEMAEEGASRRLGGKLSLRQRESAQHDIEEEMDPQRDFNILMNSDDVHEAIQRTMQETPNISPRGIAEKFLPDVAEDTLFALLEKEESMERPLEWGENFPGVLAAIIFQEAVSNEMERRKLHLLEDDISDAERDRRDDIHRNAMKRMREILTKGQ